MLRRALILVAAAAAVAALVLAGRGGNEAAERGPAPAPPTRATPERGLGAHLRALQRIAAEHGGTRAAGSPGDAATADYVEQRLRAQSRGEVLAPEQGAIVIFATRHRPVQGTRGYYRVTMRHGVSTVHSGSRLTLGVIFHDAK